MTKTRLRLKRLFKKSKRINLISNYINYRRSKRLFDKSNFDINFNRKN